MWRTLLAALSFALPWVVAPAADADTPQRFVFDIDLSPANLPGLSARCGFPVYRSLVGRAIVTITEDADGNLTERVVFPRLMRTFTAPTLSTSVTFHDGGIEHTTYRPDGTATVIFTGMNYRVHVPGGEPLAISAGRQEYDAVVVGTRDGLPIWALVALTEQSGHVEGVATTATCQALSSSR